MQPYCHNCGRSFTPDLPADASGYTCVECSAAIDQFEKALDEGRVKLRVPPIVRVGDTIEITEEKEEKKEA